MQAQCWSSCCPARCGFLSPGCGQEGGVPAPNVGWRAWGYKVRSSESAYRSTRKQNHRQNVMLALSSSSLAWENSVNSCWWSRCHTQGLFLSPELRILSKRDFFIGRRFGSDDLVCWKEFRTRSQATGLQEPSVPAPQPVVSAWAEPSVLAFLSAKWGVRFDK